MIEIWGRPGCRYCDAAVSLCESRNLKYTYKTLDVDFTRNEMIEAFPTATTYPQIMINKTAIGGYDQLSPYLEDTNYNGTGYTL